MSLIVRYIGKTVLANTLLVLFILVALTGLFSFIRELDDVGRGNYSVLTAAFYIVLRMPGSAYELFPSAVLLGSLLGLGALATHSELTVMRSAGISITQLAGAVALIGLLLMAIVVLIGEFVMPASESRAYEMRLSSLSKSPSLSTKTGYWAKSGNNFINIKTVLPDTTLVNVNVYEFDVGKLERVTNAKKAEQISRGQWQLTEVTRTEFKPDSIVSEQIESEIWKDLVNAEILQGLSVPAESMSMVNLNNQINYLETNQLDSQSIKLALWTKITNPLSTLVMLMLSLPFVFASQRAGGVGQKMFIGILLGIGYFLLNRLFTHLGLANGLSPAVSTFIPLTVFALLALVGVLRIN
ncbi:LPS export ABC transporter permease LptG [Chromatiales bacterium (ex Bugula neritina AB1)]|nr:LPS export ABC transporter permease LptG [Chromatiales bacterium (ex Bugula neritina AB1)]